VTFSVENLRKSFSSVPVLRGVSITANDGEIHALLGANGAGKSTLIKCISGALAPDEGRIVVDDQSFPFLTPKTSKRAGISVIYQELSLANSLDVADNVFLGQELRIGPFVRRRAERLEVDRWLRQLGVRISARDDLAKLDNAELQLIEIVKSLRSNPRVLILDEPTASLTEREAEELGKRLLNLKKRNLPIMYVTHRLAEVFAFADRVTVLRGGEVVLSSLVNETNYNALVSAIVGGEIKASISPRPRTNLAPPAILLKLRNFVSPGIGPIDLDVRRGEIVGVFGLIGSGRTELLETIFGARRLHSGSIQLSEKYMNLRFPSDAVARGIALVPSDRLRKSILGELSAYDNTLLPRFGWIGTYGIRRKNSEQLVFSKVASRLNLQPCREEMQARRFSGGNQQKLVLGRWLQENDTCQLLLLDEPTQGVDVGARSELYAALKDFVAAGTRSIIVTSSEPEELIQIAQRVIVLSAGRIVGEVSSEEITEDRLISLSHKAELDKDIH
jgi:ribose transport system ATP-binding protein